MTHSPTRHETGTNEPGRLNHNGNAYGQMQGDGLGIPRLDAKTLRVLGWLIAVGMIFCGLSLAFGRIMDEGHRVAAERVTGVEL